MDVFECYPQEYPIYEVGYEGFLMVGLDGGIQIAQMHKYAKNIVNVGAWPEFFLLSIIKSFCIEGFCFFMDVTYVHPKSYNHRTT